VFLAIVRTRPDLAPGAGPESTAANRSRLLGLGLVASLGLAIFVAPFASPWPDGLEAVAAKLGFEEHAREPLLPAPIPDYEMPGIKSPAVAVAVAGAVGTGVVFGLALLLSRALVTGPRSNGRESAQANESSPNTKPS
jgi:cobalt/nickel transport protein